MMKNILFILCLLSFSSFAQEPKTLEPVVLSGKDGGLLNGDPWDSASLKDKVHMVFYVDPDKKDVNNDFTEALRKEAMDRQYFGSVAIINLAASWLPNGIIESSLKKKQEQYPQTLYVRDLKKVLVKKWNLKDDASDILVLSPKGEVLFSSDDKLDEKRIKEVIDLIKSEVDKIKK